MNDLAVDSGSSVTLEFSLAEAAETSIKVYDVGGRRVHGAQLGRVAAGRSSNLLSLGGLAPGVYWLRLTSGRQVSATKICLVL